MESLNYILNYLYSLYSQKTMFIPVITRDVTSILEARLVVPDIIKGTL